MLNTLDEFGVHLINTIDPVEIISGHAPGADTLGEKFAKAYGYPLKIFLAEWNKYGKAAGPIRNEEMAKYASEADHHICIDMQNTCLDALKFCFDALYPSHMILGNYSNLNKGKE